MKNEKNKKYGLFTFIALIAGIIIGSGIYFKIGKIAELSGGNIWYIIINFSIAALGVIFGGIAISEFAIISKGNGGVVTYFDEHISRNSASAFAWYQTFAYYPVISGVVSWISSLYLFNLTHLTDIIFNSLKERGLTELHANFVLFLIIALFSILLSGAFVIGNYLSKTNGARFQSLSFVVKFLPVIVILIISIVILANPKINKFNNFDYSNLFEDKSKYIKISNNLDLFSKSGSFLAALPTVAFMYEGWIVATTVVNETKNRNRTVRLGYIIAPLIVFLFYIIYSVTTYSILGGKGLAFSSENVATNSIKAITGNNSTLNVAIDTLVLGIIIISVLGVVNGLTIGGIRLPQALAEKEMLPDKSKKLVNSNTNTGISKKSALLFFLSTIAAILLFYIIQVITKLTIDISDLSVQFSYLFYIFLYVKLIIITYKKIKTRKKDIVKSDNITDEQIKNNKKIKKENIKDVLIGYVCSVIGIFSSILIFVCGFITIKQDKLAIIGIVIFLMIVIAITLSGFLYSKKTSKKNK